MLAPKSLKSWTTFSPICMGRVNFPMSLSVFPYLAHRHCTSLLSNYYRLNISLHCLIGHHILQLLIYLGIPCKISNNKRLMLSCLNVSKNFLNQTSFLAFLSFWGNGCGFLSCVLSVAFTFGYWDFPDFFATLVYNCFSSASSRTNSGCTSWFFFGVFSIKSLPLLKVITITCFGFFISLGKPSWGLILCDCAYCLNCISNFFWASFRFLSL